MTRIPTAEEEDVGALLWGKVTSECDGGSVADGIEEVFSRPVEWLRHCSKSPLVRWSRMRSRRKEYEAQTTVFLLTVLR